MRRAAPFLLAVAVIAIVVIGLNQASGKKQDGTLPAFKLDQALKHLAGSPAPLAALHAQHAQLLAGGKNALHDRLLALRGHPVVLNKWGQWCNPCRQEFPIFQRAGADYGRRVAFVGLDVQDNAGDARKFLRQLPLTYPSYQDPRGTISQAIGIPGGAPITQFYDGRGRVVFTHQGQYPTLGDLKADIKRYLRV